MKCIPSRFFVRSFLLIAAFCSAWIMPQPARVAADQQKGEPEVETTKSVFVTSQSKSGVSTRELSKAEIERMPLPQEKSLSGKSPVTLSNKRTAPNQNRFSFTLTTTSQLDAAPQVKAAVQRALTKWAEMFDNDVVSSVNVDFGPTLFGNQFPSPDSVAVTSATFFTGEYEGLSDSLSVRTFSLQQRALYESFPQGGFRTEVSLASRVRMPVPLARVSGSLNFAGFTNPFTVGFNSNKKYDFDPSDGIDADKLDFEALMLREVGRVLGFISTAGSGEAKFEKQPESGSHDQETLWDLFRFRDRISLPEFSTAQRTQLSGGKHIFFAGGQELPLSTGRPDGSKGDGRPAGHWKDDELTGQYIGIMDPTYALGERGGITANDLSALDSMGFTIFPGTSVIEVLSNDDNSGEETLSLNGAMAVTRLVPERYPYEVQSVRVQLPKSGNTPSPTGQQIRVVIFADPARTGRPPVNPTLLLDRTIPIAAVPETRMLELMLPNGPKINSGDLYVGLQVPTGLMLVGDSNVERPHSFFTADNGASFQPLKASNQQSVNLMARAVVTARYGDSAVPEIISFNPGSITAGSQVVSLYVYGKNFYGINGDGFRENSVVRWNGQDRATEFLSGSLLRATIPESDVASVGTARISVLTKTELNEIIESAPVEIAIGSNRPVPVLASLFPAGAQVGGDGLNLAIFGKNFSRESVVRWNGVERTAIFSSSSEIILAVTKADLANAANVDIEVFTPGPGGGVSNKSTFTVAPCQFKISSQDLAVAITGGRREVFVTTESFCRWTATSNVPWVLTDGVSNSVGSGLFGIQVDTNYADGGRAGLVTVGDARFTIRQSGLAKPVSAASYTPLLAPESIASVFTLGLGNSINIASSTPLPTTLNGVQVKVRAANGNERLAPIFFTSPEQVNFQVPAGTSSGTATIFINNVFNYGQVQIAPVAPGFFTANSSGSGLAAAVILRVKANGAQSYESVAEFDPAQNRVVARPIDLGAEGDKVYLLMFGTGIRKRSDLTGVKVKIGDVDGEVSFAGAQTDFIGLDQVNVLLPVSLRGRGEVTINCSVDSRNANPVTVTIK